MRVGGAALIVLIALAGMAALLAWRLGVAGAAARAPIHVVAVGHNWWWEFVYPESGVKTANELHLPANAQVQMELRSVDVLHTLSVPEVALQADAIPGRSSYVMFHTPRTGELGGECSEICGTAHNMMRVKVIVESPADFETWMNQQQAPAAAPQTEQQWTGYELVITACARCHSLDPIEPRTDLLGPNLAHLMSRSVFAGASFTLNETNLRRWMRDSQEMKAGNDMDNHVLRQDHEAVVEYLLTLK